MRIIAGKYKGRNILFPEHIRPTQDKVRQAVFNTLGQDFQGLRVLDLFAGSGAFGLEALSRGAENVVFVDIERKCNSLIEKNLKHLGLDPGAFGQVEVYRQDAFRAISVAQKRGRVFDVIFADPPYHKEMAKKLLKTDGLSDILAPRGFLVVEHARSDVLDFEPELSAFELYPPSSQKRDFVGFRCKDSDLVLYKRSDYGRIAVTFFAKR